MSTVVDAVADGLTVSMVEVDAAAARAALAGHLRLDAAELEQPAVVAVLAAVVAAGWRPPVPAGDCRQLSGPADDRGAPTLFGAGAGAGPPGRRR